MPTLLNKRERRAQQLLQHYQTCERLAVYLGMPISKADGKKISVALFKLEREAHKAMEHACSYPEPYYSGFYGQTFNFAASEADMEEYKAKVTASVKEIFGGPDRGKLPPGFFVNGDPRGASLKVSEEGANTLEAQGINMVRDWGRYGILSPEITGD